MRKTAAIATTILMVTTTTTMITTMILKVEAEWLLSQEHDCG